MRVNSSIRDGLQDGIAGLVGVGVIRCLTCNIVTGYGSENLGRKHLRLVGQIQPVDPEDQYVHMQGFSYAAPEDFHDLALVQDAGRVDEVLRAAMELAGVPMAVVDSDSLEVLMTSSAWRREDYGHVGGLTEFVHEDSGRLHEFISEVASEPEGTSSVPLTLQREDGVVDTVRLTATGVQSGAERRDVVVRIEA
jgi:hypothetical protein